MSEHVMIRAVRSPAVAVLAAITLVVAACTAEERPPETRSAEACFGSRVLSYRDLVAEVVIPSGEQCGEGTFTVVFTRGNDTLARFPEERHGVVGFIGTADVNADGRGEFFVATTATSADATGELYAYRETADGIERMSLAALSDKQREGYTGGDRFGFGAPDQLVRAFPRGGSDTAWYGYEYDMGRWVEIARPSWLR